MLLDSIVLQLTMDPQIRKVAGAHLKSWMFETPLYGAVYKELLDEAYKGVVPDAKAFTLSLAKTPGIKYDDLNVVGRLVEAVPRHINGERSKQIDELEIFVRTKLIGRGLEEANRAGWTLECRAKVQEALKFSFGSREDEFYDLSREDHCIKIRGQDKPLNGKSIKSTLNLVNSCSTYGGYKYGDLVMICGETGIGKCHAINTPILMYDGTVKVVQDVVVGDRLMGDDSTPRNVLSLARGRDELYRVTPVKGDSYVVNSEHILPLKWSGELTGIKDVTRFTEVKISDWLNWESTRQRRYKQYRTGVHFEQQKGELPLDPYFLGVWLGDGNSHNQGVTCSSEEVAELLGVLNNKHVPLNYKTADKSIREKVLCGMLDTDGYYINGCFDLVTKYPELRDDILFLARSLGFAAYTKPKQVRLEQWEEAREYHRITISGDFCKLPFLYHKPQPRLHNKDVLVTGITVQSEGEGDYYGFEIDGNRKYLLGDFTVTHNTFLGINEGAHAINQGLRVAHVFLGDVSDFDVEVRYATYWTGLPIEDIIGNIEKHTSKLKDKFALLRLRAYPAKSLNIFQLLSKLEQLYDVFPYDEVIVDYDGNLEDTGDQGNMYQEGGTTYTHFKGFIKDRCVGIMLCQSKKEFWGQELLPKDAPNESSRKNHCVQVQINLGRNPNYKQLGTLFLAKNTNGEDQKFAKIHNQYRYARILEITQQEYDAIKSKQASMNGGIKLSGFKDKPAQG